MDELDKLLQQVKQEVETKPLKQGPPPVPTTRATPSHASGEDSLLESLRQEVEAEDHHKEQEWQRQEADARRAQERQQAAQRQEEARRLADQQRAELQRQEAERQRQAEETRRRQEVEAKKKALYTKEAQEFLAKLTPKSPDAKWFEKFATNYPSRLEAAIEYLKSLEEADH